MKPEHLVTYSPEKIGIERIPLIGKRENIYATDGLNTDHHFGCMEICFLYKGSQTFRVNCEESYNVNGGEIFVTFPYEYHDSADSPLEKCFLYWMQIELFDPDKEKQTIFDLSEQESFEIIKKLQGIQNRHFNSSQVVKECFDKIFETLSMEGILKKTKIQNLILLMIFEIIELSEKKPNNHITEDIELAVRYMEGNIDKKVKTSEIAKLIHLSESRFKQKFTSQLGVPPMDYLLRKRIELSKKLLEKGARITDVATEMNFNTSQYFCEVFKKYTMETPREFRKRMQPKKIDKADK